MASPNEPPSLAQKVAPDVLGEDLRGILLERAPVYAIIDGAAHPRLREALDVKGLAPNTLYMQHRNPATIANGPWLVHLPDAKAVEALLAFTGPLPQAVFWIWGGTQRELFLHLRHINLVEIPLSPAPSEGASHETVQFRHWDPVVMAPLLPMFDGPQLSKVWGNADGLILAAAEYGGLYDLTRPEGLPAPPSWLLRFTPEQIAALSDTRMSLSRERIADYLRDTAPDHVKGMSDRDLIHLVHHCEQRGRNYGLKTEAGFGRFTWLMLVSGGAFERMPAFRACMYGVANPDMALREIMTVAIRRGAAMGGRR